MHNTTRAGTTGFAGLLYFLAGASVHAYVWSSRHDCAHMITQTKLSLLYIAKTDGDMGMMRILDGMIKAPRLETVKCRAHARIRERSTAALITDEQFVLVKSIRVTESVTYYITETA